MDRVVSRRYVDPLDEIWIETARRIGLDVRRSRDVFASSDGRGTIAIGSRQDLDADDCLAQMILHELCHSLVQGPQSFELADWGLENVDDRDAELEHACLRVQAHLADRHGLREALAPTTTFRAFYDQLGADALAPRDAESSIRAVTAIGRAERHPWAPHLDAALAASAAIANAAREWLAADSLLASVGGGAPRHASGLWMGAAHRDRRCGECAWRRADGICQQSNEAVDANDGGCERFESSLACDDCGACCRQGYDSVTIADDDPVAIAHPTLIIERPGYRELRREGDRCAALEGAAGTYRCRIYPERPVCCRELERGGEHCLTARRRVGLSL